jgi:hypothetical protein
MRRRLVIVLALAVAAGLLIWWNAVLGVLFAIAVLIPMTLISVLSYVQSRRAQLPGFEASNRTDL